MQQALYASMTPTACTALGMAPDSLPEPVAVARHIAGADCYVSRDAVADAVRNGGGCTVIHMPTAVKVDIFVAGVDAFDRERLQRRMPVAFSSDPGSVTLFVDTAEDTILRKLDWYRRGGERSDRQWRDVVGIVNAQSSRLDRVHLREWAARLGVSDLTERVLTIHDGND